MSRRSEYYLGARKKYYPVGSDCVLYHAYWDGTAKDHSIYGNHGTVTGPTFVENGLSFDGNDDRVSVATTNVQNKGNSDWAFFWWINATATGTYPYLLYQKFGTEIQDEIFYDSGSSYKIYYDMTLGYYRVTASAGTGAWHLVGIEVDKDVGTYLSIDGVITAGPTGTLPTLVPYTASCTECTIGAYTGGTTWEFTGTMGETLWFVGVYGTYSGGTRSDLYNYTKSRYGL